MKRLILIFSILLLSVGDMLAGGNRVFFISRNLNRNIVVYDVQLNKNGLNTDEPLHVYWYNNEARPGETYDINFIQRKLAYGYSVIKATPTEARIKLKAYKDRELRLCKKNGKWVALVAINGKECILTEIYAKCKSKTSVEYVELRGTAVKDGSHQKEIVKN